MSFYTRLNMDQVSAAYRLFTFLRRLRVVGTLHARTVQATQEIEVLGIYDVVDMTDAYYGIEKIGYDPSKELMDAEQELERLFGKRVQQLRGTP